MPRIKRWFPVSHDLLDDAEVIELARLYGDRAILMWLRMLSWADRNEGVIGNVEQIMLGFGRYLDQAHPHRSATKAALILEWMLTHAWVKDDLGVISVCNYAKYHRTRETVGVPPNLPNLPNLKSHKNDSPQPNMSVQELVESWNDSFDDKLPKVEWPLSESRKRKATLRLKEHRSLDFWQQVFDNIASSSFLLGSGNGNWRCTLDFLIANDSNCTKVYEGAYANGKGQR